MNSKKWITIGSATIMFLWVVYYFVIKRVDDPGTFGDMFGALNTLFTGLAFVGVVISLLQQNEALKQQQEELELYKRELKNNTEQLTEQNNNIRIQRFENTLYNMIGAHIGILSRFQSVNPLNEGIVGNQLINKYAQKVRSEVTKFNINNSDSVVHVQLKKIRDEALDFDLAFNNLMFILQFIEDAKFLESELLERNDRIKYANIFISQLSSDIKFLYSLNVKDKMINGDIDSQHLAFLLLRYGIK